jgi:hypothetical protein
MSELVVKGQAWIVDDKLVQDQVTFSDSDPSINGTSSVVVLIEDIWDDLFSSSGTYHSNGKGYFYWEYQMTDTTSDTGDLVTINFECPKLTYEKAKEKLIPGATPEARDKKEAELIASKGFPFDDPRKASLGMGEYVDYYITKFIEAYENSLKYGNIQRTEVTFPGSTHIGLDGNTVTVNEVTVTNYEFGDISNLLCMF